MIKRRAAADRRSVNWSASRRHADLDPIRGTPYRPAACEQPHFMRPDTRQQLTTCSSHPAVSTFPDSTFGSACTSFRGLLGVHSHCGPHTRAVTTFVTAIRRLQTFRRLHACPGCFRLERLPGGPRTHWKTPPFTAHVGSGHSLKPA